MTLHELNSRPEIDQTSKLYKHYAKLYKLFIELNKREMPDSVVLTLNQDIDEINSIPSEKLLKYTIKKKLQKTIQFLEREIKLVPKRYYQNIWMAVGMSLFGLPVGIILGSGFGNMAFLGIGLPFGMIIGMAIGSGMDKKALKEGRQLDLEIEY